MCLTVELFVDYKSHRAGEIVTLAAHNAYELLKSGKACIARIAGWEDA
jgi:hypothetical protein